MPLTSYIKALMRRRSASRPARAEAAPDLELAAPLVGFLQEAEPRADLLAQIEADLDTEISAPAKRKPDSRPPWVILSLVFGIFLGIALTAFVAPRLTDRQQIVARPAPNVAWSPLGEVTLQGADLRAFVRAKCRGFTHFSITLHGQAGPASVEGAGAEVPLMNTGEKILMECIF